MSSRCVAQAKGTEEKENDSFRVTPLFIDEVSVNTKMARAGGCALRGKRCVAYIPHGCRMGFTLAAATGPEGVIHHVIFGGVITVESVSVRMNAPTRNMRPGDLVICENPAAHKVSGISGILQKKDTGIRFPSPCRVEPYPIERAVAQGRYHLGKVEGGIAEDLHAAFRAAANRATAAHACSHFKSCGYEIHGAR